MNPIFALYVTSERKAAAELAEAGFETWAPTYMRVRPAATWDLRNVNGRVRSASRSLVLVETPLFPGYVFCRVPVERFRELSGIPRVIGVVRGADAYPRAVPEDDFGDMLLLALSGRLNDRAPATKARPRKARRKGKLKLNAWFEAAEGYARRAA